MRYNKYINCKNMKISDIILNNIVVNNSTNSINSINLDENITIDNKQFGNAVTKNINTEITDDDGTLLPSAPINTLFNNLYTKLNYSLNLNYDTARIIFELPKCPLFYGDEFDINVYFSTGYNSVPYYAGQRLTAFSFAVIFDPTMVEPVGNRVILRNRFSDAFIDNVDDNYNNTTLTEHKITLQPFNSDIFNIPIGGEFNNIFLCSLKYKVLSGANSYIIQPFAKFTSRSIMFTETFVEDYNERMIIYTGDLVNTAIGSNNPLWKLERLGVIDDIDNNNYLPPRTGKLITKTSNGKLSIGNYLK